MGKFDVDVTEVKRLLDLVESHGLDELTVEEGDLAIIVRGRAPVAPAAVTAPPPAHAEQPEAGHELEPVDEPVAEPLETDENIVEIKATLVGVFYRAPSPDAPAFIEVGDTVEIGSEIGLIEAMKVFSPIPSEVAGVIVDIPGPNGKLVHQGDVLVRVRVSEE